jgi:hypothetical protein
MINTRTHTHTHTKMTLIHKKKKKINPIGIFLTLSFSGENKKMN